MNPTSPSPPRIDPDTDLVMLDGVLHRIVERGPRYRDVLQPDGKTVKREHLCTWCRAVPVLDPDPETLQPRGDA